MVSNKPFSWSHSALEAFATCPLQLRETRILKTVSDRNRFNMAGTDDHKVFEDYCRDQKPLPERLKPFQPKLDSILALPGILKLELEMAVDEAWQPVGWFSKDAWARAKVDLNVACSDNQAVAQFDWKFGKYRKDTRFQQLDIGFMLFEAIARSHGVEYDSFFGALVWVNDGFAVEPHKRTAAELESARCDIMAKVERYREAYEKDDFPAKQNGLCKKHCPVVSCKFNGRSST